MPIEFPGNSISQADVENLAVLDDQIEGRLATKRRLADSVLDRLAAGVEVRATLSVERRVYKLPDGITEERLVVGSVVRHRRLTGSSNVLTRARAD